MSTPGLIRMNYERGYPEFDDGARVRNFVRGQFADARDWKAYPGTADMTDQLRAVARDAPENTTVVLEQGTYPISDTVHFSRNVSIYAEGVTFDLGTNAPTTTFSPGIPENHDGVGYLNIGDRETGSLNDKAAVIFGTLGANRPSRVYLRGLKVKRTAATESSADRLYAGIVVLGAFECTFEDLYAEDFRDGIVFTASGQGVVYNRLVRPKCIDCRYAITFYAMASGWANNNSVHDGRNLISSTVTSHADWTGGNSARWEHMRVLWGSTGTLPNQNQVYGYSFESSAGRKLRLEGGGHLFANCRWENSNGTKDITIGEASRSNSNYGRNTFIGSGSGLHTIYESNRVEYLATTADFNSRNTWLVGQRHGFYGTVGATAGFTGVVQIGGTASDQPLLTLMDAVTGPRHEQLRGYARLPASIQASCFAGFAFADSADVVRNSLAMRSASPWDLRTLVGLTVTTDLTVSGQYKLPMNIGGVVDVTLDGTVNLMLANPNASGKIVFKAQSTDRTFDLYNVSSSNNDVLRILNASRNTKFVLKASDAAFTGTQWGLLAFYEESTPGSPTLANGLFLSSSQGGGGTKPYMIAIEKGMWINRSEGDFDTRIAGDNVTNLFFVDASTDRVGIGTAAPLSVLEVESTATSGVQLVTLDQQDTDMPFIDYRGTASANTSDSISTHTTPGAVQGFVQIEINGVKRWMPFYADPSA